MADYITKIRTSTGDKQIDYTALANKPTYSDVGAAASEHEHSAVDITSGILDIARGGTGAATAAEALAALGVPAAVAEAVSNSGAAKIQTGSYVGTGTYGADNPCSLTFNFPPIFVALFNANGCPVVVNGYDSIKWYLYTIMSALSTEYVKNSPWAPYYGGNYNDSRYTSGKKSADGKTLTWYNTHSTSHQANESETTYHYLAIG